MDRLQLGRQNLALVGGLDRNLAQKILDIWGSSVIGLWGLGDASGTTVIDSSPNARHGISSNVILGQPGIGDGKTSTQFNGTNSYINLLTAGLAGAFNGLLGSFIFLSKKTSAFWTAGATRWFFRFAADANNRVGMYGTTTNNQLAFDFRSGGSDKGFSSNGWFNTDWEIWSITWNRAGAGLIVFHDDMQIKAATALTVDWAGALTSALIASYPPAPTQLFTGYMAYLIALNAAATKTQLTTFLHQIPFSTPTDPNSAKATHAAAPLTTPTYDGTGYAIHPDVLYIPGGLGGYDNFMAMTPYDSVALENPSILASNDRINWAPPVGLTNPIDPQPAPGHNADADIILAADGKLYCYYMMTSPTQQLGVRSSADGVTWSAETVISLVGNSPAVIYDPTTGLYTMWFVDAIYAPNELHRAVSAAPDSGWGGETLCTVLNIPAGKTIWHLDVVKASATELHAFICVCDIGTTGTNGVLYFATSTIDGLKWKMASAPLLATEPGTWYSDSIYRSSGIPIPGGYDLFYSGLSAAGHWRIGRTTVTGL